MPLGTADLAADEAALTIMRRQPAKSRISIKHRKQGQSNPGRGARRDVVVAHPEVGDLTRDRARHPARIEHVTIRVMTDEQHLLFERDGHTAALVALADVHMHDFEVGSQQCRNIGTVKRHVEHMAVVAPVGAEDHQHGGPRATIVEHLYPGRVAVEAMASGVPVLASDSGSLPEVLADAGDLVPPGDVAGLADAIVRLRDDPVGRARMAVAGRDRAAHFSWPAVAERHRALYEEMIR